MKEQVAVLGAGPMGLAVAYQLVKDGFQPIVFEADDRVGGMAASFDFGGLEIERYYHFHCTSDVAFEDVLHELGIHDKLKWVRTKMGYWYQGRLQPWGTPFSLLRFRGLSFAAKFRYGLHTFSSIKRNRWKKLDKLDAATWIRRWVGNEAFDVLWKDLFEYKFYHLADNVSAAWIWSRIRRIGRSRYSIFHEKLGYLEGGSQTLLNAMSEEIIRRGGEIHLKSPVIQVVVDQNVVRGVETKHGTHQFEKVISTIPIINLPRIVPGLPDEIKTNIQSLENIGVVCVIVKLKKSLTNYFWLNTNDSEMDIPGLVEFSNLRSLSNHVVYVPFYLPQTHTNFQDDDLVFQSKVKSYLKKINSNLNDDDFADIKVNRYKYAQPICQPGHMSKLPPVKLPIGGLWAADTSYYYPEDRGISESISLGRKIAIDVLGIGPSQVQSQKHEYM
jgi:protoporphyrinogen oxidase